MIFRKYDKEHSWQYDVRLSHEIPDIRKYGFSETELANMRVGDFTYRLSDKSDFEEIRDFIQKYEWLGTLPPYPTHYFTAHYGELLAGVLIYSMPNAFSKLLGERTKEIERLLARGACASWTPKNLASSFISWSVKYMVENTQYRVFTAYGDPMAKELGTIYQACNWLYLGQTSGSTHRFKEPGSDKWVSDRKFRNTSSFKKYARESGIEWGSDFSTKRVMNWENIPDEIEQILREEGRKRLRACEKMEVPPKHKYAMIRGRDRRETKQLLGKLDPKFKGLQYPKIRGC